MTRTCLLLAAAICLGLAGPARAQTLKIQVEVEDSLRQQRLHENKEIMRRLLNRSLLPAVGLVSAATGDQLWVDPSHSMGLTPLRSGSLVGHTHSDLADHFLAAVGGGKSGVAVPHHGMEGEGTYLKGQGVVFSLTLPRPAQDPRPEPARPAGKPLSEWEILRRELRGEKVLAKDGWREKREPRVADVVLMVLAENGQHLSQLAPEERVTVAITFRGQQCTACHGVGAGSSRPVGPLGSGAGEMMPGGGAGPGGAGEGIGPGGGGGTPGGSGTGAPGGEAAPGSEGGASPGKGRKETGNPYVQRVLAQVTDQVLLGDLRYKQGLFRDAVQAYQEAVRQHKEAIRSLTLFAETTHQQWLRTYLAGAELHGKLAQVQLALGEKEEALRSLAQVSEHAKTAEGLARPPKAASGQPTPTPSGGAAIPLAPKLLISAPKKLLDQVGTGKMTLEEFRKAVTVEYLTFGDEAKP
jgi:hypothetical protein